LSSQEINSSNGKRAALNPKEGRGGGPRYITWGEGGSGSSPNLQSSSAYRLEQQGGKKKKGKDGEQSLLLEGKKNRKHRNNVEIARFVSFYRRGRGWGEDSSLETRGKKEGGTPNTKRKEGTSNVQHQLFPLGAQKFPSEDSERRRVPASRKRGLVLVTFLLGKGGGSEDGEKRGRSFLKGVCQSLLALKRDSLNTKKEKRKRRSDGKKKKRPLETAASAFSGNDEKKGYAGLAEKS